ncbi:MAG: leucyl aminopeptidase [Pseudomonadota bacterium]
MKHLITLIIAALLTLNAAAEPFAFSSFSIPPDGRLVIPVSESEALTGLAATLDEQLGGALSIAAEEASFTAAEGQTLTLYGVGGYTRIDMIGVGRSPASRVAAENFGGTAAALLANTSGGSVQILWPDAIGTRDATGARVAFGYALRDYRFDRYMREKAQPGPEVRVLSDDDSAEQFTGDLSYLAKSVHLARDMNSEPGNIIYPQSFVDLYKAQFNGLDNVRVKVLDETDLLRLNMGAHYGVGKGSVRPPRLLIVEYLAGGDAPLIALAGKGVTFDTGGISLKKNDKMWMMKGDLAGAGVVMGTVLAAARRGEPVNVVALAALAENMPSGVAIRPGDVLTSMSGLTIEIRSTDAEGRLVLADAVHYAQERYNPAVLINVATLTGSVGRALGDRYAGVFGRHDALIDELSQAADTAGERVWRLPLDESHFEQIKSKYADVINSGVGSPGASVGAAFVGSFVDEDQVWAHFDIAGVDFYEKDRPTVPMGYSGWGVRTLDEYLRRQSRQTN